MTNGHAWMVRAGNDNEFIEEFVEENFVAIGWKGIGDVSSLSSREDVKRKYREHYSDHSKYRAAVNTGQVYRFAHEMEEGDLLFTYDKSARIYYVGTISGEYRWNPDSNVGYPHYCPVNWGQEIPRDHFSTPVKNTLGSTLTVFSLDEQLERIQKVLSGEGTMEKSEEEEESPPYFEEVQATSEELISDIIAQIDPFDFEELVAALLRAMGYNATTTESGSDRGVDIVAHPDALGFESPLVKVQVKQRTSTTGGPDMREFSGTLGPNEKGLYVSTGGFTRGAREAARNSSERITLLDRDDFIELLLQYYDTLEPEYKTYVPLKQIYIPTTE